MFFRLFFTEIRIDGFRLCCEFSLKLCGGIGKRGTCTRNRRRRLKGGLRFQRAFQWTIQFVIFLHWMVTRLFWKMGILWKCEPFFSIFMKWILLTSSWIFFINVILFIYSDMGCHIDGFIAVVAHTHVLQQGPVTGRAADVIAAANTAAEVALRLVRPGKKVVILLLGFPLCFFMYSLC